MRKLLLLYSVIIGMLFFATGCFYFKQQDNIENSKKLRVEMTKEQVLKIMGEPVKGQQYVTPDVWFYYIDTQWNDGLTTEDECLPLVFRDGKLDGWGWDYYERARVEHKYNTMKKK